MLSAVYTDEDYREARDFMRAAPSNLKRAIERGKFEQATHIVIYCMMDTNKARANGCIELMEAIFRLPELVSHQNAIWELIKKLEPNDVDNNRQWLNTIWGWNLS